MKKFVVAAIIAVSVVVPVDAATKRSSSTVVAFKKQNICPSTGKIGNYPCPGYVVDHGIPLCADGADAPYNMFYQKYDKENSLRKDRDEVALCKRLGTYGKGGED